MHPPIVASAFPLGLSMPGWESCDHVAVARWLRLGVERVADAGADFYICPDNTAHIVLESIAESLPIPGLHVADVVCSEMQATGRRVASLLGTYWTMNGPVYVEALHRRGLQLLVPHDADQQYIHCAIFEELCLGRLLPATTDQFVRVIEELRSRGADCAILGCTEIPLLITQHNSPLPVLDSTRLLAKYAVRVALANAPLASRGGWIRTGDPENGGD